MAEPASKRDIPKAYDPQAVERRIYEFWVSGGYFSPTIDRSKEPFVVIMPPPNVTGELHMGHALTKAVEDLMVRWHRMKGDPTLYLPGTDHAGIATQVVVERLLASEGVTKQDLGREAFVDRVWQWVDRYGDRIYEQIKRLGASCDWSRKRFTLDEGPSNAVRTTFVNLYKKGLIYKGERIVNWCPRCRTALSDLEVKHREESGNLYHIRYPLEDGSGQITVATARPETLLGDTAVAVHPEDGRYTAMVGRNVLLPVLGRAIPITTDEAVDPEFGTGALKLTPGHAASDFEIGQRNGLPTINIMNADGTLNENAGHYQGQDMFGCREKIVEELDREGLLYRVEPIQHSVGHCDRCDAVVEPIVSLQWYVRMEPLAKPARDAVSRGEIRIIPDRFTKVYFNWMDNIRDWCISRQLWWGHRIPVWYCEDCDDVIVELEDPATCSRCGSSKLYQDSDVLDTWFSSALWTHSTLGWPDKTEDLDYFYPTAVMETGYDILFFWVARMIVMGIENMGKNPFHTVYLHGLVLDPEGVKMSKTRGNVLDPLELIDLYGADALRFALTTGTSPGNDMRLNEQRLEASRNFANKLWNAARFVMTNLERVDGQAERQQLQRSFDAISKGRSGSGPESLEALGHRHDRWILSRLNQVTAEIQRFMDDYQFGEAQRVIHDFLWGEYCDWYIEMAKIRLRSGDGSEASPLPVLAFVLERVLRLLHPFMPFVTEELWQNLIGYLPDEPGRPDALISASYPESDSTLIQFQVEAEVEAVIEIVRAVRNLRAEFRIGETQTLAVAVDAPDIAGVVESETSTIETLARIKPLTIEADGEREASSEEVALVLSSGTIRVPLAGLVDIERESQRLADELAQLDGNLAGLRTRLADENFLSKAPEEVVERERRRLESVDERRTRVSDLLSRIGT